MLIVCADFITLRRHKKKSRQPNHFYLIYQIQQQHIHTKQQKYFLRYISDFGGAEELAEEFSGVVSTGTAVTGTAVAVATGT